MTEEAKVSQDEGIIATSASIQERVKDLACQLEARLRDTLPSYMIPTAYVPLHFLPVSASAKTDRKKLRTEASKLTLQQLTMFAPKVVNTEQPVPLQGVELCMQKIWSNVLGIESDLIGLDDSFFRLGGDSIKAMRLVTLARDAGLLVKVQDIFTHRTLADLSRRADVCRDQEVANIPPFSLIEAPPLVSSLLDQARIQCKLDEDLVEDIYPCTPMQGAIMDYSVHWPGQGRGPGGFSAQILYQLPDDLDLERFQGAWQAVISANPILRTRVISTSSGFYQVVVKNLPQWTTAEDLETQTQKDMDLVMSFGDPLLRCCIITQAGNRSQRFFMCSIQHAIYDGWSLSLLDKDIERAYLTGLANSSRPSFKTFIKHMTEADRDISDQFWRSRFERGSSNGQPERQRRPLRRVPLASASLEYTFPYAGRVY